MSPDARSDAVSTPKQRLMSHRLGVPVEDWVYEKRRHGASWREIANELSEKTGENVTYESVRQWFQRAMEAMPN